MRRRGRPGTPAIVAGALDICPDFSPRPDSPLVSRDPNNFVYFMVHFGDVPPAAAARAVSLMKAAVAHHPDLGDWWRTLGIAHYRAGDWPAAIRGLRRARELDGPRSLGVDGFFLAMAHRRLGDEEQAGLWYDRSVAWMDETMADNEELRRFRSEAAALLGRVEPMPNGEEAFARGR